MQGTQKAAPLICSVNKKTFEEAFSEKFKIMRTYGLLKKAWMNIEWPDLNFNVLHGYLGKGYGYSTSKAERAMEKPKQRGLLLETTYSAKSFAAMTEYKKMNPRCGPL